MRKENRYGRIAITTEGEGKFVNFESAVLAAHAFAWVAATKGYLTTTSCCKENNSAEVCIHLENNLQPLFPQGYKFSFKEITSHQYYSDVRKTWSFLRCVTYYFKS